MDKRTLNILNSNDIFNIKDMFDYFPKKYVIYCLKEFSSNNLGNFVMKGIVLSKNYRKIRKNLFLYNISIKSNDKNYKLTFFNKYFLYKSIIINKEMYFNVEYKKDKKTILLDKVFNDDYKDHIECIYNIKGITNERYNKLLIENYNKLIIEETIDIDILKRNHLITKKEMYYKIHFPKNKEDIKNCYVYLKYEEIFLFQLKWNYLKNLKKEIKNKPINYDLNLIKKYIKDLPYELTTDQKNIINEIYSDLKKDISMNRLIQADVGSGKTIIAFISALAVISDNKQVAFMSPTEVLTIQHFNNFNSLFNKDKNIKVDIITSSINDKKEIVSKLKNNEINIIFGTHSLIQDNIEFNDLSLVIIDEEQRFGVSQREELVKKGINPNYLILSATPIPRTLALYYYNDIDVSTMNTRPSYKASIITKSLLYEEEKIALNKLKEEINKGNQGYIILPLIEDDEYSVLNYYDKLKHEFSVGILHGKQKNNEKNNVMNMFINKEIDILISTTVIEVGIDNKNATVILIIEANKFGISQLHQLRGRVGRSNKESYCFLLSDNSNNEKLKALEKYEDGFKLSEIDLKLRGFGELLGSTQSGKQGFKYFNLFKDLEILKYAIKDAKSVLK